MKRAPSVSIEDYILQDWCFDEGENEDVIEIASVIRQWAVSGNWLDLGCGPMLSVWPMFAKDKSVIWGCDRHENIAEFHNNLKYQSFSEWPEGLLRAVNFYNDFFTKTDGISRIRAILDQIQEITIGNILDENVMWHSSFNTIIQVGCFGCLDSIDDLKRASSLVFKYLRPSGRFISVTWLPRASYVESETWGGINLSALPSGVFVSALLETGLYINEVRNDTLDDPQYHKRYVIIAEKNMNLS